jgi:hypothetical protein
MEKKVDRKFCHFASKRGTNLKSRGLTYLRSHRAAVQGSDSTVPVLLVGEARRIGSAAAIVVISIFA